MVNYEIDPSILSPFIPKGTEIDLWNGKAYISLVGFMFLNTRVLGYSIPFHRNFEEVNLRTYVKRGDQRGVVFIKEIVPRWAIAYLARCLYNENYIALPMNHLIIENPFHVEYQWKFNGKWQKIGVDCKGEPQAISEGSEVEFITEHYWGYTTQANGETKAYQVEHPKWRVWEVIHCEVDVDVKNYDPLFAPFLKKPPSSTFLAEGSAIKVFRSYSLH